MFGLSKIAAVALALAVVGLSGAALRLSYKLSAAESDAAVLRGMMAQCSGRLRNIQEDRSDDATVDDPDFTVPERWMRGGGNAPR